jgi:hypothetical protein
VTVGIGEILDSSATMPETTDDDAPMVTSTAESFMVKDGAYLSILFLCVVDDAICRFCSQRRKQSLNPPVIRLNSVSSLCVGGNFQGCRSVGRSATNDPDTTRKMKAAHNLYCTL